MKIKVLFFAVLRDLAGEGQTVLQLEPGQTVASAAELLASRYPRMKPNLSRVAFAVNQSYANGDTILHDNDELALIPPVSGGR